jgi:hypothetical protein
MKYKQTLLAASLSALLTSCGGSDGSSDGSNNATQGQFSLAVSDNPANAKVVNIAFKQVVLKNSEGSISFDVSQDGGLKNVDLISVQGQSKEWLVSGQSIPVGEYQMCIYMKKSEVADTDSSYVEDANGNVAGLTTNSNGSCGGVGAEDTSTGRLFINKKFTIAAGTNNFVAEFDLFKILQGPKGKKSYWTLKPTGIELINLSAVGAISGTISPDISIGCGEDFGHAVYLYPNTVAVDDMGDFRDDPFIAPSTAPIASARGNAINDDVTQGYEYEFGFVVAGNYSLGYTCTAQNDDPADANEATTGDDTFFIHAEKQQVEVLAEQTTIRNF